MKYSKKDRVAFELLFKETPARLGICGFFFKGDRAYV